MGGRLAQISPGVCFEVGTYCLHSRHSWLFATILAPSGHFISFGKSHVDIFSFLEQLPDLQGINCLHAYPHMGHGLASSRPAKLLYLTDRGRQFWPWE